MTSHPKSPRTTGNEAEPAVQEVSSLRGRRNKGRGRGGEGEREKERERKRKRRGRREREREKTAREFPNSTELY